MTTNMSVSSKHEVYLARMIGANHWGTRGAASLQDRHCLGRRPIKRVSLYCFHGPFHRSGAGYSQVAASEAAAPLDVPTHRHSYVDCGRSGERGGTRLPAGLQHLPDFFYRPAAVAALRFEPSAMRPDESLAREIRFEAAGDSCELPDQSGEYHAIFSGKVGSGVSRRSGAGPSALCRISRVASRLISRSE